MKGKVTITRSWSTHSDDVITIRIRDEVSNIEFVEAEMSLADFAQAVTGLAFCKCELEVRGLDYIGKKRVREPRTIECPLSPYTKREELAQWLREHAQEDGWMLDTYLGSQGSVNFSKDSKGTILNYAVFKYVDPAEGEDE
jgi:hypothetical protein